MKQNTLYESQSKTFDQEYLGDRDYDFLEKYLRNTRELRRVGDFGGGNGRFLDRILNSFPSVNADLYEISDVLCALNQPHDRKNLIKDSFLNADIQTGYDVVFLNWVLHHLVSSSTIQTRLLIKRAFAVAAHALTTEGTLVVSENVIDSFLPAYASSVLLYSITSSRLLRPLTRHVANTAGVGIYYLTESELVRLSGPALRLIDKRVGEPHNYGRKISLLGMRSVTNRFYIFKKCT